jgi:DNA polymerase-1
MGKRIAMNAPIQGTASDIMKVAMIKIIKELSILESTDLLLQIHDEIIIQTPKALSDKVSNIVKKEMENACALKVPLFVDIKENVNLSNLN